MTNEEMIKKFVQTDKIEESLEKYKEGYPVQYIIGNVDFYGRIFEVNENVLIPRFETETLVEKTIKYVQELNIKNVKIADLGTGSGCIGITLKKEIDSEVSCFDISKEALSVAKKNAISNGVEINFIEHNILNKIEGRYNVIVSNPPYIAKDEEIEKIVRENEPHMALFADENGLEFYKKIISYAKEVLDDKFLIAFEIGKNQGKEIESIAKDYFPKEKITIEKDLCENDRYVFIKSE
ncbi:MAG: peptide chain release factor N(5)-glutamine methyltransferase [bacterium]